MLMDLPFLVVGATNDIVYIFNSNNIIVIRTIYYIWAWKTPLVSACTLDIILYNYNPTMLCIINYNQKPCLTGIPFNKGAR